MAHVDGYLNFDTNINTKGFNKGLGNINSSLNSFGSMLKRIAALAATAFSVKAVVNFGKTCVNTATEVENAWVGLNSIVNGQGKSFDNAKKFIQEYVSDGLVPLKNAVIAYKNLSLRGYNEDQIKAIMVAFKNSATYARQSQYSLGDAISTATEGLKNENSIVVDNAGVTKNVAKMWEDYAKKIGVATTSLTKEQKIQAEVNGILEETKFQMGDAAKYSNTYSGQLARLNAAFTNLKTKIGNIVKVLVGSFLPVLNAAISSVGKLVDKFTAHLNKMGIQTDVVDTLESIDGVSSSGMEDLSSAADNAADNIEQAADETEKLKRQLASFDELNVLEQPDNTTSTEITSPNSNIDSMLSELSDTTIGVDIDTSKADVKLSNLLEKVKEIWGKFQTLCEPLKDSLLELWETLKKVGGFAGENLKNFYNHLLKPIAEWTLGTGLPKLVDILNVTLQNIDFGKINQAFNNLYKALEPFAEHVGEGLLWFCENILSPLAVWTANQIVPAFLNILTYTIKILDTVIEDAKVPLGWLWENFLKPIAEWTGGIIVTVLEGLVSVLKKISESDVAISILEGLLIAITTFAGLSKLIGLVSVLFDLKQRLAIIKKVIDGLTIACNTIFDLLMLSNPIVLLISLLVGLIATFVILWNKCEWFRDFWINIWNKIKETTYNVCYAITNFFIQAWENIKNAFTTVKDFFIGVWDGIKSVFSTIAQWINSNVVQPIIAFFTPIIDFFASIFAVIAELTEGCINVVLILIGVMRDWINEHVIIPVTEFFTVMWEIVSGKAAEMWESIKVVFSTIFGWISEKIIEPIKNAFKTVWEKIKSGASEAWNGIKSVFGKVAEFFGDVFSKAWAKVKEIFSKGGEIFNGIKEGILNAFKTVVNSLIDGINTVIAFPFEGINNALDKIHDINLFGHYPFEGLISRIKIPEIPHLATGTVVPANYGEFLAVLGDNKKEREYVTPESAMTNAMINALQAVGLPGGSNDDRPIIIQINGKEIFRAVKEENDYQKRRHGGKSPLT